MLKKSNNLKEKLLDKADKIRKIRQEVAGKLENGISEHLKELEMKNVRFKVDFSEENDFMPNGMDKVEFLVSTNVGEPVKSLSKVASGGELSRIMLAVKTMLAEADNMPTLIFDEIDTGISGVAAKKVAEKMSKISDSHQVLCVTHLAQIATYADVNLYIQKAVEGARTVTKVQRLSGTALVKEIARLLDGDEYSEISLKHAEDIINKIKAIK